MNGSDFWSRRRAAVRAEEAAEARVSEAKARAAEEAEREAAVAEKTDEELLEELGLPDPDGIEDGEAMRAFLAREVPERLRRRALRRFWRTNPVLANLDGLVDYDEDYRSLGMSPDGVKTAYEVGRGMFADLTEASDTAAGEPETGGAAEAETDLAAAEPVEAEPQPGGAEALEDTEVPEELSDGGDFSSSRAKRMRYTFES